MRGISIFPFIILSDKKDRGDVVLINHEKIHIRQQIELLIVPFYIWYFFEFVFLSIKFKNWQKAYLNISFEKEAYKHEKDLNYLKKRTFWSFLNYF